MTPKLHSGIVILFTVLLGLTLTHNTFAQELNLDENGVALHGYDPVAYFTEDKAVLGDAANSASHNGATYYFASADNKAAFEQDPDKYAPQYGGYCAMGTSLNKKFDVDPTQFAVIDDKLYVNLNDKVKQRWSEDIPGNIEKANANWPEIKDKDPEELNKN